MQSGQQAYSRAGGAAGRAGLGVLAALALLAAVPVVVVAGRASVGRGGGLDGDEQEGNGDEEEGEKGGSHVVVGQVEFAWGRDEMGAGILSRRRLPISCLPAEGAS